MRYLLNRLCLFVILFLSSAVQAQQYYSEKITTTQGLPSNRVRALELAANGVLWIGTENGIASYQHHKVSTHLINDSLPFYNTWSIEEDGDGGIWFAGYGEGVAFWKEGKWLVFTTQNGLPSNNARRLFYHNDHMYVGMNVGVASINVNTFQVDAISFDSTFSAMPHVLDFAQYIDRLFAFTVDSGVYEVTADKLVRINTDARIYAAAIFNDSIWLGKEFTLESGKVSDWLIGKKLRVVNTPSKLWRFVSCSNDVLAAAWGMEQGKGGLYSAKNNRLINSHYGLDLNDSRDLVVDSAHQVMYVSSMTQGVFILPLDPFVTFSPVGELKQLVEANNMLWALNKNRLRLYKGYRLYKEINRSSLATYYHKSNTGAVSNWSSSKKGFALPAADDTSQITLYQIRKSATGAWLNTSIGMFAFDERGAFEQYLPTHNYVFNVAQSNAIIEAIPYGGIRWLTDSTDSFYDLTDQVPHNVLDIAVYEEQVFFASVLGGLYGFKDGGFTSFVADKTLGNTKLRKLYSPNNQELWIISDYGKLYKANVQNGFVLTDSISASQLYGEVINDVVSYKGNTIILTNRGVNVLDSQGVVRLINQADGLKGALNSLMLNDDTLNIASNTGYYALDLRSYFAPSTYSHGMRIVDFKVNNENWDDSITERIKLSHYQNALEFYFQPINYKHNTKLNFSYRLKKDERWNALGTEQHLILPYLESGNYNLQVKVKDAHTGMEEVFDLHRFQIAKAYYQSRWFYVLIILVVSVAIYLVLNKRTQHLLAEEQRIAAANFELDKAKMQGLLSRMNPHFLFNSLNSIQSFVIDNNTAKAVNYLGKFAKLMRSTLILSQRLMITLTDEVSYLKSYIEIENLRFGNAVQVHWEISDDLELDEIEIPSMILQPIIENAFVHGFASSVTSPELIIIMKTEGNLLEITIKDNGVGFDKKQDKKESQGIKMMKQRLALLGSGKPHEVYYASAPNLGTTVVLKLHFNFVRDF